MKNTITCLFLIMTFQLVAQEDAKESDETTKNAIYLSAGTIVLYSSVGLNYERRIAHANKGFFKNYYANIESHYFTRASYGESSSGYGGSLRAVGLTGTRKAHFEVALGINISIETETNAEDLLTQTIGFPEIAIGYRYQYRDEPIFRVGIGFPRLIYISIGYSF